MTDRFKIPLFLQIFLFAIPINFYVIGDGIGSGIQWFFFRYQQTTMGTGFIFLSKELTYVQKGMITGKSAIFPVFWVIGVSLIVFATILMLSAYVKSEPRYMRIAAVLNLGGIIAFLLAIITQYGLSFQSAAGIAIPFGLVIILITACWQYHESVNAVDDEQEPEADESELSR
jgi:hypothetical protein